MIVADRRRVNVPGVLQATRRYIHLPLALRPVLSTRLE
jgi:hypothetical protein